MVQEFRALRNSIRRVGQKIAMKNYLNNPTSEANAKRSYETFGHDRNVNAYGGVIRYSQKSLIDAFNKSNIAEGAAKDRNESAQIASTAEKNGTVDFKKHMKRLNPEKWKSILGIGG